MRERPVCLTVAGTDPSGGAGVAADLATFAAHGVHGTAAVTALTVQDTERLHRVVPVDPDVVAAQVRAVLADSGVDAVKVGMLGTGGIVRAVAAALDGTAPVVLDPVLTASVGGALLDGAAVDLLLDRLVPLVALVTPNATEAGRLTGIAVTSRATAAEAGAVLLARGAGAVLVKGGHLDLGDGLAADCLVTHDRAPVWLEGPRLGGVATHGTGCVLSSAVAARLARGASIDDAVVGAKAFTARAMQAGARVGRGAAALDPWGAGPC